MKLIIALSVILILAFMAFILTETDFMKKEIINQK